MPEEEELTEPEVAPLRSRAEPNAHVEAEKGRELNPCAVEWVSAEVSKELATDLFSQSCLDQVETGNAGAQQLLDSAPASADSAAQVGTMKEHACCSATCCNARGCARAPPEEEGVVWKLS